MSKRIAKLREINKLIFQKRKIEKETYFMLVNQLQNTKMMFGTLIVGVAIILQVISLFSWTWTLQFALKLNWEMGC